MVELEGIHVESLKEALGLADAIVSFSSCNVEVSHRATTC